MDKKRPIFYSNTEDPYLLPDDMPVAIQFSGGRTSGYMLKQIIDRNGTLGDNVHVLFQNTGREMPETLDFVRDCGERFGCKITWLEYRAEKPFFEIVGHNSASRNGEPFEMLLDKKKFTPAGIRRFCTEEMKYKTGKRYLKSLGLKEWYSTIGFRLDEKGRYERSIEKKQTFCVKWFPLYDAGVSKNDIFNFWTEQSDFDLNLENVKGNTPLGNCDGCFLKSEKNLANLCRYYPERAEWWNEQEKKYGWFHKDRSWQELIDCVERQGDMFTILEESGGFCESSHGVCETY